MDPSVIFSGLWGALFLIVIIVVIFAKRRRRRVGAGAAGTMYDWQTAEKRRATEIIVEERAAARDPEHADDVPPDIHGSTRRPLR